MMIIEFEHKSYFLFVLLSCILKSIVSIFTSLSLISCHTGCISSTFLSILLCSSVFATHFSLSSISWVRNLVCSCHTCPFKLAQLHMSHIIDIRIAQLSCRRVRASILLRHLFYLWLRIICSFFVHRNKNKNKFQREPGFEPESLSEATLYQIKLHPLALLFFLNISDSIMVCKLVKYYSKFRAFWTNTTTTGLNIYFSCQFHRETIWSKPLSPCLLVCDSFFIFRLSHDKPFWNERFDTINFYKDRKVFYLSAIFNHNSHG